MSLRGLLVELVPPALRALLGAERETPFHSAEAEPPPVAVDREGVDITHRRRRVWVSGNRAHIELREVPPPDDAAYIQAVEDVLSALPGVESVRLLPGVGRVVVAQEFGDVDELVGTIDQVERRLGVTDRPFGRHRPDHPADLEPIAEGLVAVGADLGALALAGLGKGVRLPTLPIELDAAALLTVASYVPWVRRTVERWAGTPLVGVELAVARAFAGGLSQSFGGPAADVVHRASAIGAGAARRAAWERLEPRLLDTPPGEGGLLVGSPRSGEIPPGPGQRFERPTTWATVGAAGIAFALDPDPAQALSFLVSGTSKATRWGAEAFSAHLGMLLASRDVLVLDPGALGLLDRLDTLVVPDELLVRAVGRDWDPAPLAPELVRAARDAGIEVWAATDDPGRVARFDLAGTVADPLEAIPRMQASGRVVAAVTAGDSAALAAADVGLGLLSPGRPAPWSADLVGGDDLVAAHLLVLAAATARTASRQAASVALAGAGVAGLMSFGTIIPGNLNRVMGAVNLAAVVAHANSVRLAAELARQPLPEPPDDRPFHAMSVPAVLAALGSSRRGLTDGEWERRRVSELGGKDPSLVRAVAEELVTPFTPFLSAGAGLSAAAGSTADAVAVASVLGLNAVLGGTQRYRAERATADLARRERRRATVVRDGAAQEIDADDVVVGDLIHLLAGDVVPADARLIAARNFEVDESRLTGESMPVAKHVRAIPRQVPVAERSSMAFGGTTVVAGSGAAIVVAAGSHTEAYRGLLLARGDRTRRGIEARLEEITTAVAPASVIAGAGVLAAGLAHHRPLADMLGAGVSLAVAAVPEGLPLLVTAAQQAASRRLAGRGVIVRDARAVEALGRVDVLCADKTGTLTLGRIRVATVGDGTVEEEPAAATAERRRVLAAARAATPDAEDGRRLPHPTDRAILYAAEAAGLHRVDELGGWVVEDELPFEPGRGYHATVGVAGGVRRLYVKGAPEILLPRCGAVLVRGRSRPLGASGRAAIEEKVAEIAGSGRRVLLVAERELPSRTPLTDEEVTGLVLVGTLALEDPVRETAPEAIGDLRRAGVRVIMITGDHPATAAGIGSLLGLDGGRGILTGPEIDTLAEDALAERLAEVDVCARVTPAHKVRIVRALQARGRVVAMTGDGANDAAAIRLADVGIALGTRATDAARDASDLVVTDDRIETIVSAVAEGRGLWRSVRDATSLLVGGNLGETVFTLAGTLPTGRPPLNARQLLLVNLFTDVLPAMAVAVSPPPGISADDLLAGGPDAALGDTLTRAVVARAATTAAGTTAGWVLGRVAGAGRRLDTVALVSLVGTELAETLALRWRSPLVVASSLGSAAALAAVVQTPGVSRIFGCTPLTPGDWVRAAAGAGAAVAASRFFLVEGGAAVADSPLDSALADR